MECTLCPRKCGIDRTTSKGVCGEGAEIRIAKAQLHFFEEPIISGSNGSGAIFFSGCPLKCVFCQNPAVSRGEIGSVCSVEELAALMLSYRDKGAHNINLVTPTHFADSIAKALKLVKSDLGIPVVYNCGGYETADSIKALEGLVDIYLPDLKYYSSKLSGELSRASDYFYYASRAISQMLAARPQVVIENGLMKSGVMIRHLVLPGCIDDSLAIVDYIAENYSGAYVSLMRQYTPEFYHGTKKNLKRKLTSYEYNKVVERAEKYGLNGFIQQKGCESSAFTPDFH